MAGRFAPSPTSDLHAGNLRTALLAWLFARTTSRECVLRVEDLDQQRVAAAHGVANRQVADLAALGLRFDGDVWWQSSRRDAYGAAVARLGGDVYECFCTRREIAEAAGAPHADGHRPYPGTCATLTPAERARRRAARPPALRVRARGVVQTIRDLYAGEVTGTVDDFVLVRNDGVAAYNLAVVVDDLAQGVDQVVRGDDLLSSSPRQAWLALRLGGTPPEYAHVPLAVNTEGVRLAKRDGAVSLADLGRLGIAPAAVLSWIAESLGLAAPGESVTVEVLAERFDPAALPRSPWVVRPPQPGDAVG
ncbi:tRNA glutamyl-Q(34) synthetase GluQRS [Propionicicella superfundia]|uniref:tRNA glutamyl-Q(34) synthetase GluQRS n=1 Tax=Propionicicella superfundia TaxID=348582 RepID=UPI0004190148|nr:tRNA glutamyl-Q(34) synthetase GluQRS [Propionicicella superfundia]